MEDAIIGHLLGPETFHPLIPGLTGFTQRVQTARWRVLSARKADGLLREKLFDRVYAVRVRAFARNCRNAELDMHFSLTHDLTPLDAFLAALREHGLPWVTAALERGSM